MLNSIELASPILSGQATENTLTTNYVLRQLVALGSASSMVELILKMLGHSNFFEDFTMDDIAKLSQRLRETSVNLLQHMERSDTV